MHSDLLMMKLQIYTSDYNIRDSISVGNISDKQKGLWHILSGTESIKVCKHYSIVITTAMHANDYQQNANYIHLLYTQALDMSYSAI